MRQQLAAGNQRYQQLQHSQQLLVEERKELQLEWSRLGQEGRGKLARDRLYIIQRELEQYYQRDKALEEEISRVESECTTWLSAKADLHKRIQQNRIDQEKLMCLLNEGLDAY
ncbi:MAG TPA: hypothetical protein VGL07_13430 [Buttiauxella sp.]